MGLLVLTENVATLGPINNTVHLTDRFVHPRLDQLVWILIHKVTPAYMARAEIIEDHYRRGRSKQLTTYQKYFKTAWKKLWSTKIRPSSPLQAPRSGGRAATCAFLA